MRAAQVLGLADVRVADVALIVFAIGLVAWCSGEEARGQLPAGTRDLKGQTEVQGYRIELKGYKGGIWTVDLGDELTVVNRREEAEIVLTMQQRDFIHLVNGEMNPQLLILAQKLKVQGDIRKAVKFENLLVPSSE